MLEIVLKRLCLSASHADCIGKNAHGQTQLFVEYAVSG